MDSEGENKTALPLIHIIYIYIIIEAAIVAKLEGVRSFLPRSAEAQYIIYLFIIYIENTAGTLRNCAVGFEVSPPPPS